MGNLPGHEECELNKSVEQGAIFVCLTGDSQALLKRYDLAETSPKACILEDTLSNRQCRINH